MTRREISKRYYERHKEECKERNKKYREEHKKEIKVRDKKYIEEHKDERREKQRKYREEHKEELNEKHRKYRETHKDNKEVKANGEKRRLTDPLYRFKHNVRCTINRSFTRRGTNKRNKTEDILGCTIDEFKEYIEAKFEDGMNFENYGEWHLDHIKPLASAKTYEEVLELCKYTNFQPLWAEDNLRKGAKIL